VQCTHLILGDAGLGWDCGAGIGVAINNLQVMPPIAADAPHESLERDVDLRTVRTLEMILKSWRPSLDSGLPHRCNFEGGGVPTSTRMLHWFATQ
jgi:hypothetical protein